MRRAYLALVEGRPRSRTGTIDAPLGRDYRAPERRAVGGRGAARGAHPLQGARAAARGHAGRGAPGDRAHAPDPRPLRRDRPPGGRRPALRPRRPPRARAPVPAQRRLGFRHPFTGEELELRLARCPTDLAAALRGSGARRASRRGAGRGTARSTISRRPVTDPWRKARGPARRADDAGSPRAPPGQASQSRQGSLMSEPGIKELLEAGLHFGHQTRRWDPRMRRYIFGERDGIHIIDLLQTEQLLAEARRFAAERGQQGRDGPLRRHQEAGPRLGQGVGRALRHAVRQPALARRAADQLPHDVGADRPPARADRAARRTASSTCCRPRSGCRCEAELAKLEYNLGGVRDMKRLPQAALIIDLKTEAIAVREAERLRIPIIGLVDSNVDPVPVDYPDPRQRRLDPLVRAGDPDDRRGRLRGRAAPGARPRPSASAEEEERRRARGGGSASARGRGARPQGGRGGAPPAAEAAGSRSEPARPRRAPSAAGRRAAARRRDGLVR